MYLQKTSVFIYVNSKLTNKEYCLNAKLNLKCSSRNLQKQINYNLNEFMTFIK